MMNNDGSKWKNTGTIDYIQSKIDKCIEELSLPLSLKNTAQLHRRRRIHTLYEDLVSRREAQRHMENFLSWAGHVDSCDMIPFCKELGLQWYRSQEMFFGNFNRPRDESICDDECVTGEHLSLLCKGLNLYACYRHGTLHECHGKYCSSIMKTSTWEEVCMFSGAVVGKIMSSIPSEGSSYEAGSPSSGFHYAMSLKEYSMFRDHRYSGVVDEGSAIMKLKRGSELEIYETSREKRLQSDVEIKRTNRTFSYSRKIAELQRTQNHMLRSIAENVLRDLLYDNEARTLFNETEAREAHARACADLLAYHSRCKTKKTVPNIIDASSIFITPILGVNLLPIVEYDRVRQSSFATLCVRLWELCHTTPHARNIAAAETDSSRNTVRQTTCTFVQFCIAVLYGMREGVYMKDESGLEKYPFVIQDARLIFDLPAEDHVNTFGERSRREMRMNIERESARVHFHKDGQDSKSSIFKRDGERKTRNKRSKRRKTLINSGNKKAIPGKSAGISEHDVLPPHFHSSIMGDSGMYEKCDVTRGRNFLWCCLNTIDPSQREEASRSLRF